MTKGEAWQQWWKETHGKNLPMGGYHPMEGYMYEAWSAGWDARLNKECPPCNHKEGRECPAKNL